MDSPLPFRKDMSVATLPEKVLVTFFPLIPNNESKGYLETLLEFNPEERQELLVNAGHEVTSNVNVVIPRYFRTGELSAIGVASLYHFLDVIRQDPREYYFRGLFLLDEIGSYENNRYYHQAIQLPDSYDSN